MLNFMWGGGCQRWILEKGKAEDLIVEMQIMLSDK